MYYLVSPAHRRLSTTACSSLKSRRGPRPKTGGRPNKLDLTISCWGGTTIVFAGAAGGGTSEDGITCCAKSMSEPGILSGDYGPPGPQRKGHRYLFS